MKILKNLLRNCKKGATAIEYGLIASLIAVVIIVALKAAGTEISKSFSKVDSALQDANAVE